MNSITDIINPIKLLSGSHADTGKTGQGCFMNLIAYLNGEPQITDQSDCVCVVVRPIAIWLNDFMDNVERARLIPFIERAMGSRTNDKDEVVRRAWLAVDFANKMYDVAAYAANAAKAAYDAAKAAYAARRQKIIEAGIQFLDDALPKQVEQPAIAYKRAEKLIELSA